MDQLFEKDRMIRISINPTLDIETLVWTNDGEYWIDERDLLIRFDRAATGEAKTAEQNAANVSGQEQSAVNAAGSALTPFYQQEMNAQHAFTPGQTNELLNAAGAPLAGTGSAAMGEANSQTARTRNSSGFSAALDQNARQRAQQMGTASLGIGAEDIMGAKALNQEGAKGLNEMYNTDTGAMLGAMGQEHEDINSQVDAGKSGWYQNMLAGINTFGKLAMPKGGG